jgi:histidyl-tRNA synthetase
MDYYTGPVYEAVVEGFSSSILGGGRYDELIGQFAGKKIPAVGCSIGFERILSLLQEQELKKASPQSSRFLPRVLLIRDGIDTIHLHQQAEKLREGLRSEGIGVEVYLDDDDVGRQFKYAEAAGITWAIKRFDAASSSVTVRYLPERTDLTLSMSEFKARLRGNNPVQYRT